MTHAATTTPTVLSFAGVVFAVLLNSGCAASDGSVPMQTQAGTGPMAGASGLGGAGGAGGMAFGGAGNSGGGVAGSDTAGGGSGGAGANAGGAGGNAGGPPAFTSKPLSIVAYSPYRDGQSPSGAQPSKEQVREDLLMLKPLVDGVRVYGTGGANAYVPEICDELGLDLHVGAWIDGNAADERNVHDLAAVVNANHPSIKTAIVGNEVLHRAASNGMTEDKLIVLIELFKSEIRANGVKVAAADTYPQWMADRPRLAAAVDVVIWHTYGWWSGTRVEDASAQLSSRYDDMLALYPGKPIILGETGWPSRFDRVSKDMSSTAIGSEANQARFYKEALAGMRARNLPMWMFSSIDEQWKGTSGEGQVGAYWGIWTSARQPKQAARELLAGAK